MNIELIKLYTLNLFIFSPLWVFGQINQKYLENQTPTYEEAITFYEQVANSHEECELLTYGETDAGRPLQLFIVSTQKVFDPEAIHKSGKLVILINNDIHPGEPCGVNACMKLVSDILSNKDNLKDQLKDILLCIIPVYNIGGALNRSCCSRVNQRGPEQYGFRGNAKNLDLNRDFIKMDSRNAFAFVKIFRTWDPDIFIDTHTSDGADYQYVMTLLSTQPDKLTVPLNDFLVQKMLPSLYSKMKDLGYPMIPYVNVFNRPPDKGIPGFLETPRYSTGYTALYNTLGFTTEAHMLKPFKDRVLATYDFLNVILGYSSKNLNEIKKVRTQAFDNLAKSKSLPLSWEMDTAYYDMMDFKGYEAEYNTSPVTGLKSLSYNHEKPFTKKIKYFSHFEAKKTVTVPDYYIIPQAWSDVITRLTANDIKYFTIEKDTILKGKVYYIENYKTVDHPYEGHYLHHDVDVSVDTQKITFHAGDYIIPVNQKAKRFIVETLEPEAPDSYFAWNFFDEILQQKEWFSPYVFDNKAQEIFRDNPALKETFEKKKETDINFAKNQLSELYFIYRHSKYYEKSHNRYPVMRYFGKL